jgi:hypothetical protein
LDRLVVLAEPDPADPELGDAAPPDEPEDEHAAAMAPAASRLTASGRIWRVALVRAYLVVI